MNKQDQQAKPHIQQPGQEPSLSFDLDASDEQLLDEFGLLMAAEYYYMTTQPLALMDPKTVPELRPGAEPVRISSLAERFRAAKGC